jgi:hypothetical protein
MSTTLPDFCLQKYTSPGAHCINIVVGQRLEAKLGDIPKADLSELGQVYLCDVRNAHASAKLHTPHTRFSHLRVHFPALFTSVTHSLTQF